MNLEKLAPLGALGMMAGVAVVYAGLLWLSSTTAIGGAPGATGGVDTITRNVVYICWAIPAAIMIGAHFAFFKQLKKGPTSLNDSAI
jgi:hypothetical protein